jgi:biopolymer transport protein ExbD
MRQFDSATRVPIPTRLSLVLDFALLVFLATWVVWWPDLVPGERGPRVELPLVETWRNARDAHRSARLTLTHDGRIYLEGQPVGVDQLGDRLQERARDHDAEMRAMGSSGFEDVPGGGRMWRLAVVLRSDRAVPWRTVHRVIRVLGESGFRNLLFLARKRDRMWSRLRTCLWAELASPAREPRSDVRVRVLPDPLGGVLYVVNGRGHGRIAAAREAVRRTVRSFDVEPRLLNASIDAPPDARLEHVVAALEAVRLTDIEDVMFYGRGPGEVSVAAVAVPVERD